MRRFVRLIRQLRARLLPSLLLALLVPCVLLHAQEDTGPDRLPGGRMLRGTVTATSANTLTLRNEDGESYQVVVTPNTRVIRSRQPATFKEIQVGDGVGAGGVLDGATHTLHAAFVGAIDAAEVRRAQADLGKTYIIGRITAMDVDQLRLTVRRPDGVTQVIGVDEGTSFRRGGRSDGAAGEEPTGRQGRDGGAQRPSDQGESITLADIKVGESIAARGTVKDKLFTPTELHVFSREHGRPRGGSSPVGTDTGSHPDSAGGHR